jgi:hypothetical protein
MDSDPFGRAIRDYQHGNQEQPLIQRDGEETREHPIKQFYFDDFDAESERGKWLRSWLDGPLLDIGAGAGRDTLYFQRQFETVAIEVSDPLIETMRERGVTDVRHADMLALRETFERDRFRSALAYGTQLGLTGSIHGLRKFLGDLAFVTTPGATAVLDCVDPAQEETREFLGYRADPTSGLAHRVMHFEYKGEVGETLLFQLFSPGRVREATIGTGWEVAEIRRTDGNEHHFYAVLQKL